MDAAEKFRKKTEIRVALKEFNGLVDKAAESLKITEQEILDIIPAEEIDEMRENSMLAIERHLHKNAAKGDTKAAEILLAAHYPEMFDPKIRYEVWRAKAKESAAQLPDLVIEVIPKSDDTE